MAKHVVDKLVQKYDTHQGPRLLDALSVLCVCNGVPIKKNQGKTSMDDCNNHDTIVEGVVKHESKHQINNKF